jgi:protein pelota
MRVLHQDRRTGEIKVQIDSLDDLWHLYNLIDKGDIVRSVTYRRDEVKSDKLRSERGEKKRMTLGIRVEKVEFHESEARLRILGVIEEGPQDIGSYHTLNLEEGDSITIVKVEWKEYQLARIMRAVEDAKSPRIVFTSVDYDEAVVAVMRQFGMQEVAHIYGPSQGKMFVQKEDSDFYGEIIAKVKQEVAGGAPLVILGPGFAKEELLAEGKTREPEVFKRAFLYHTGQSGMAGIHELMKKGIGADVLKNSRVALETKLVEDVLTAISTDGLVAYGPEQVHLAVQSGAVETLLVLDTYIRKGEMEKEMSAVEKGKGVVVVVSSNHEAGHKLEAIGGVATILRFKVA